MSDKRKPKFLRNGGKGSGYFYFSRRVSDDRDYTVPHFHAARELFLVGGGCVRSSSTASKK
ncbi:MAG: hypothetical protein ACLUSP_05190 [Christensenellales bacterium]